MKHDRQGRIDNLVTFATKKSLAAYLAICVSLSLIASPTVTDVTALQRELSNGLVDIAVTMQGSSNDAARAVCTFVATNSATKAAIQITQITQNGDVTGAGTVWTRKFVWDAKADAGEVKIDDVALFTVVEFPIGGVQLWENGPYWAGSNVGATKPEEYGYYFWWGDTVGYRRTGDRWNAADGSQTGFSFNGESCLTYGRC